MDEIKRLEVIQQVENRQITVKEDTQRLKLSPRQVWRLMTRYRDHGRPLRNPESR
ncbi:MAG: helix-turn-helix domain-containing protein [Anaerolineales bacterium]